MEFIYYDHYTRFNRAANQVEYLSPDKYDLEFLGMFNLDSISAHFFPIENLILYFTGYSNRIFVYGEMDSEEPSFNIGIATSYGRMLFKEKQLKLIHEQYKNKRRNLSWNANVKE